MRGILGGGAFEVLEAADYHGALAVENEHRGEIGLALIDLVLPDGNGYQLAKTLLAREPDMRVLFVSGQTGAELRKFLDIAMPEVHFLQKPFQPAELLRRVQKVLESPDPFAGAAGKC